jgi:serine protease inhibitor
MAKTRNDAHNSFLKLVKKEEGNRNFIFSPASLELALALLAEGLEDEVKRTVSAKLGFDFENVYTP